MSDAAFTLSTAPIWSGVGMSNMEKQKHVGYVPPCETSVPSVGSSTKTTSPRLDWA